jgi:hypothetical protein
MIWVHHREILPQEDTEGGDSITDELGYAWYMDALLNEADLLIPMGLDLTRGYELGAVNSLSCTDEIF